MKVGDMLVDSYTLVDFDRPDLSGHITLYINPTEVMIEDYSVGDTCEEFFGRDDHEYRVWVGPAGARKILAYLELPESERPLEDLTWYLLKNLKGDWSAATKFRELAEAAGISPGVWCW